MSEFLNKRRAANLAAQKEQDSQLRERLGLPPLATPMFGPRVELVETAPPPPEPRPSPPQRPGAVETFAAAQRNIDAVDHMPRGQLKTLLLARQTGVPVEVLQLLPEEEIDQYRSAQGPLPQEALSKESRSLREMRHAAKMAAVDMEVAALLSGNLPEIHASEQALNELGRMRVPFTSEDAGKIVDASDRYVKFAEGMANALERGGKRTEATFLRMMGELAYQRREVGDKAFYDLFRKSLPEEFADAVKKPAGSMVEGERQQAMAFAALGESLVNTAIGLGYDKEDADRMAHLAAYYFRISAEVFEETGDIPFSSQASQFQKLLRNKVKSDGGLQATVLGFAEAFSEDPVAGTQFIAEVTGEQAPQIAASVGASVLASPALGIAVGIGSAYQLERYGDIRRHLLETKGVDILTIPGSEQLVSDPDLMAEVRRFSRGRALPISGAALAAYLSAGRLNALTGPLRATAAMTVLNPFLEGGGEYLAGLWSTGEVDWYEVAVEAGAGLGTAPFDVITAGAESASIRRHKLHLQEWLKTGETLSENLGGLDASSLNTASRVVASQLEEQGVEDAYVSADQLLSFDQENPKARILDTLGLDRDEVRQAAEDGHKVKIAAEAYVRHIVGDDAFRSLIQQHVTFDPDGYTLDEIKAFEEGDGDALIESQRKRASAVLGLDDEAEQAFSSEVNEIIAEVEKQILDAGQPGQTARAGAMLVAHQAAARAVRIRKDQIERGEEPDPLSPLATYRESRLQFSGDQSVRGGFEATPEGAAEAFSEWGEQMPFYDARNGSRPTSGGFVVTVLHASTHDISTIDLNRVNKSNYLGRAFYSTDSAEDVNRNYAGFGPDLLRRIGKRVDEMEDTIKFGGEENAALRQEFYDWIARRAAEDRANGDDFGANQLEEMRQGFSSRLAKGRLTEMETQWFNTFAEEKAEAEFVGPAPGGVVYDVFMRMTNPVYLNTDDPTVFRVPDEDLDTPPAGTTHAAISAVREVATVNGVPGHQLIQKMQQSGQIDFSEAFTAQQLHEALTDGDAAGWLWGELGYPEGDEPLGDFSRQVFETMGYDGAVMRADRAFPGMQLEEGTQHYISFNPKAIKSIRNPGKFGDNPILLEQDTPAGRVSTRFPTQKASTEDPLEETLVVGVEAMKAAPKAFAHNAELVSEYPGSRTTEGTADERIAAFKEEVKANLKWLYSMVPEEKRESTRVWYAGANRRAKLWADQYDMSMETSAAVLAALSPQKDWFQNVSLAERTFDIYHTQQDAPWSATMAKTADRIFPRKKYGEIRNLLDGRTLADVLMTNSSLRAELAAAWIRVFDEAHNDRGYRELDTKGNYVGEPSGKAGWGSLVEIGKAVNAILHPGKAEISAQLGGRHKVRNFYNNIVNPSDTVDVTIDTHAVAAALLMPHGGNAVPVAHNFGNSLEKKKQPPGWRAAKNAGVSGAMGTYGIYADAYREAAADLGILPRELQSITWEAVRALFPAKWKTAENASATGAIWLRYKEGEINAEEARQQVFDLAGGFGDAFLEPDSRIPEGDGAASYTGESRSVYRGGPRVRRRAGTRDGSYAGGFYQDPGTGGAARGTGLAQGEVPAVEGQARRLPGAERKSPGGIIEIQQAARRYAEQAGIPFRQQAEYAKVDPERAARIARAYEDMEHAPQDPDVQRAYRALIDQTVAQYRTIKELGYTFDLITEDMDDPYPSVLEVLADLRDNKHMWVYPTDFGFGTQEGFDPADNMLMELTDEYLNGKQLRANDVFRIVHDVFGHGLEGALFRARGEENAWQAHIRLYYGDAVGAATSETRGQNSWLNYGPHGEANRTAKVEDTVFADQKMGLMPEWTWTEGVVPDAPEGFEQGPRGRFTPADMIPEITTQDGGRVNLIQLFAEADASTVVHELGHFWLDQLAKDAVQYGGSFARDWRTLTNWWVSRADSIRAEAMDAARRAGDSTALEKLSKMTDTGLRQFLRNGEFLFEGEYRYISVAMHEQFARGTEDYARRGQAPSLALADAFAHFAAWIRMVYKAIRRATGRDSLDVQFNAEVTELMDRLLATEAEIELASSQFELGALFDDAEQAGMTPEQFADHQRKIARAKDAAKAVHTGKHMAEIARRQKAWWTAEREAMRPDAEEEIANRRGYRLLWTLTHKMLPNEEPAREEELSVGRIDKEALERAVGTDVLKRLPRAAGRTVFVASSRKGGEAVSSPGEVAHTFGYEDPTQMVHDLLKLTEYKQAVEDHLDYRMRQKHGTVLDGTAEEASATIHKTGAVASVLQAELAALRTTEPAFDPRFMRLHARNRLKDKTFGELRPDMFYAAERRAAKAAAKALKKGDRTAAYAAQFQRLLNHHMAREAVNARKKAEKQVAYLRDFKRKNRKFRTLDAAYVDRIKGLVDLYDFDPQVSPKRRMKAELEALNQFVMDENNEGADIQLPEWLLAKDRLTHFRDLTSGELEELHDTVRMIERQGRLKKKLLVAGEERDRAATVTQMLLKLDDPNALARARSKVTSAGDMGVWGKSMQALATADAFLLKMEFLLDQIDGQPNGIWQQAVFQPISDAAARKADLDAALADGVLQRIKALPRKVRRGLGRRVDLGELGRPGMRFTRGNLIMLALNAGNESNREKLIEGWKKDGWNINETLLSDAFDQLTREEWDLIQHIWDAHEQLWPEVEKIERARNGVAPERVDAISIETRHGTYRGGYFPMTYDPERSSTGSSQQDKSALETMKSQLVRATVNSSMTKARTGVVAPVSLDFRHILLGLNRTTQYVSHYEAVQSVNRLLLDPRLRQRLIDTLGMPYYRAMTDWLAAVATEGVSARQQGLHNRIADVLATNTTSAMLGLSYTTMMAQLLGYTATFDRLMADTTYGPVNAARTTADLVAAMGKAMNPATIRFVKEASGEMRHRVNSTDRDLRQSMKEIQASSTTGNALQRLGGIRAWPLMAIAAVQFHVVDVPTWMAAYTRATRATPGDHDGAVAYADRVVRMSQSAGGVKDLAPVQQYRGVGRLLTMFYSWFSALYGILRETRREASLRPSSMLRLAARIFVVLVLQEMAMSLIRMEGEEDEELDEYALRIGRNSLMTATAPLPVVRDIGSGLLGDYGYSASPVFSSVGKITGSASRALSGDVSERELQSFILGIGMMTGFPSIQTNRVLGAMQEMADGNDVGPMDFLRGYKD